MVSMADHIVNPPSIISYGGKKIKIACLGWGSLLWRSHDLNVKGRWRNDGPELPIEFARVADDGRLTLVLHWDAEPIRVYWIELATDDLSEAIEMLRKHEGTIEPGIDFVTHEHGRCCIPRVLREVNQWLIENGLDAAVWTGLDSNFESKTGMDFSHENVIKYLKGLEGEELERAKEHIRKAPEQVRTAVRKRVEEELGWTQIDG